MADPRFHQKQGSFSIAELLEISNSELHNNSKETLDIIIEDVAPLDEADASCISFFSNKKYVDELENTKAGAVVLHKSMAAKAPKDCIVLLAKDPYLAYAKIASKFYDSQNSETFISEQAVINDDAILGKNLYIDSYSVIEAGAELGDNVHIGPGCYIGKNVVIAENTKIFANCTITHSLIGKNCIIHPGVRIGQDGFGFATDAGKHIKVPQLGRVLIGENVEIGANSTIDRGASKDTKVGDYTKIDNLVMIGHNVEVGKGCFIVSQVGIAGSTKLGDYVIVGGQAGFAGHLNIGSNIQIAARSGVHKDLDGGAAYGGAPVQPIRQWQRQTIFLSNFYKDQTNKG